MSAATPETSAAPPPSTVRRGLLADAVKAPNLITLVRLVMAVILFVLIARTNQWLLCAILFGLAAGTDALDGYVARRYQLVTALGRILDPFADKFIIIGCFISLLARGPGLTDVTASMVIVIFGRESFITSLRGYLEKAGHDFSATWSGKIKMIAQCIAISICLVSLSGSPFEWLTPLRLPVLWVTVGLTLYSGVEYFVRAASLLTASDE